MIDPSAGETKFSWERCEPSTVRVSLTVWLKAYGLPKTPAARVPLLLNRKKLNEEKNGGLPGSDPKTALMPAGPGGLFGPNRYEPVLKNSLVAVVGSFQPLR